MDAESRVAARPSSDLQKGSSPERGRAQYEPNRDLNIPGMWRPVRSKVAAGRSCVD